jgi:hypothetical protein
MFIARFVEEGGYFPRGYGLAYRDCNRQGAICYPVPLNLLVRYWRDFWFWLQCANGVDSSYRERIELQAWQSGYRCGHDDAQMTMKAILREFFDGTK